MLNQVVLIGRLVRDPELRDSQGGKKFTTITVAVPRAFKGSNGDYETDFVATRRKPLEQGKPFYRLDKC